MRIVLGVLTLLSALSFLFAEMRIVLGVLTLLSALSFLFAEMVGVGFLTGLTGVIFGAPLLFIFLIVIIGVQIAKALGVELKGIDSANKVIAVVGGWTLLFYIHSRVVLYFLFTRNYNPLWFLPFAGVILVLFASGWGLLLSPVVKLAEPRKVVAGLCLLGLVSSIFVWYDHLGRRDYFAQPAKEEMVGQSLVKFCPEDNEIFRDKEFQFRICPTHGTVLKEAGPNEIKDLLEKRRIHTPALPDLKGKLKMPELKIPELKTRDQKWLAYVIVVAIVVLIGLLYEPTREFAVATLILFSVIGGCVYFLHVDKRPSYYYTPSPAVEREVDIEDFTLKKGEATGWIEIPTGIRRFEIHFPGKSYSVEYSDGDKITMGPDDKFETPSKTLPLRIKIRALDPGTVILKKYPYPRR